MIIPAKSEEEALEKFRKVLKVANDYGLKIKWKKCTILKREIEFLGFEVKNGKIRSTTHKVKALKEYKPPTNTKEVQRFLGLTGYFRRFIEDYASIAKPLSDLLRKDKIFKYEIEQHETFEKLKQLIMERPVLALFQYGFETEIHTDASKNALAAILFQRSNDDNQFHPVNYMSVKTSIQEQKWSAYELEIYAVVVALRKWRIYLIGFPFKVITKAFEETMKKKTVPKIARWAMELQQYEMEVFHRSSEKMKHVDALSRICYLRDNTLTSVLKENQMEDERIKAIVEIIQKQGNYQNYFMKNNLLYRMINNEEVIVIPESMYFEITRRAHSNGHFKSKKMEELINEEFFIPNIKEKITKFVQSCVTCILSERKSGKPKGFLHPIYKEDKPLSTLHLDHLGPMPSTSKNFKHIFTIIDAFTKFTWIFPVKNTTTDEMLKKLKIVTGIFGNPWRIITDRGGAFTSTIFKEFCESEKIELFHRGNGQVERVHRTIIPALTKLSIEDPEKWYKHVRKVQLFINKTYSRPIGMSPAELFFGIQIRTNDEQKLKETMEQELAEAFFEDRDQLRLQAKNQIQQIQEENKKTYNAKRKTAQI